MILCEIICNTIQDNIKIALFSTGIQHALIYGSEGVNFLIS